MQVCRYPDSSWELSPLSVICVLAMVIASHRVFGPLNTGTPTREISAALCGVASECPSLSGWSFLVSVRTIKVRSPPTVTRRSRLIWKPAAGGWPIPGL